VGKGGDEIKGGGVGGVSSAGAPVRAGRGDDDIGVGDGSPGAGPAGAGGGGGGTGLGGGALIGGSAGGSLHGSDAMPQLAKFARRALCHDRNRKHRIIKTPFHGSNVVPLA